MNKNKCYFLVLVAAGFLAHFIFYGRPAQVVFDEVYFGRYASDYLSGEYYFDPHPPLGKMLLGGTAHLFHGSIDKTNYGSIGNAYANSNYLWYRLLPALAGTLLPLVIFLLVLNMGMSGLAAFTAGSLAIFENSLLVQSRMVSLDSLLLLFGFLSLLLYFRYRRRRNSATKTNNKAATYYLVSSSIATALAFSTKWTGLTFLGLIMLIEFYDLMNDKPMLPKLKSRIKRFLGHTFLFFSVGFAIYFSIFAVHFALLTKSGQGDAFMTQSFQKTLSGNEYANSPDLPTPSLWQKFTELNKVMFAVNAGMNATHSYSSPWYSWPFMARPVFYWQEAASSTGAMNDPAKANSYIYYLGNPLAYWLGAASICGLAFYWLWLLIKKRTFFIDSRNWKTASFIIIGYAANLLPFAFIRRPMFLYHYETSLVFGMLAIAFILDALDSRRKKIAACAIMAIALAAFLFFSPLTYGTPLSDAGLRARMWFSTWR